MTWQPIETAPKRRKVIVSWVNEFGKRRTTFASFFDAGELDMDDSYTDSDGADEDGKNADAGWFEDRETGDPGYYELREPLTHWMPLPDPPTVESATSQNAGATPTDTPVEVGAQNLSSSLLSPVEGRQPPLCVDAKDALD